jgi:hypothetical protein
MVLRTKDVASSGQDRAAAAVVGPETTGAVGGGGEVAVVVEVTVRVGAGVPAEDVQAASTPASSSRTVARNGTATILASAG